MRKMRLACAALLICLLKLGCSPLPETGEETPVPVAAPADTIAPSPPAPAASPTETTWMSAEAQAYLDAAMDLIQEHSIKRDQVDWESLRGRARGQARDAQTTADTHPAIEFVLRALGDFHSFFLPPEQAVALQTGSLMKGLPGPEGKPIGEDLAYLSLPAFAGSREAGEAYASGVQGLIRALDAAAPCGWIVDLRENGGGDFWPMLAGVGPLLGTGRVGAFAGLDDPPVPWTYRDGEAREGKTAQIRLPASEVYHLDHSMPPVAVLVGEKTASSGEAAAIAFRGRPDTRSFGQATVGLTTGNEPFVLSDGGQIFLAVSRFADREGHMVEGPLTPDELVSPGPPGEDPALEAASAWLRSQPTCAGP